MRRGKNSLDHNILLNTIYILPASYSCRISNQIHHETSMALAAFKRFMQQSERVHIPKVWGIKY
jgi:hypothetical protein